jgi:hypothetical protein
MNNLLKKGVCVLSMENNNQQLSNGRTDGKQMTDRQQLSITRRTAKVRDCMLFIIRETSRKSDLSEIKMDDPNHLTLPWTLEKSDPPSIQNNN